MSVVLALSVAGIAQLGEAQASAPVSNTTTTLPPGTPTPGQIQSTLPTTPALPQPKTAPSVTPPSQIPAAIPPGGPTVTVQRFEITGNTVFSNEKLEAQIASYLNQPLTLAELYKVADVITTYYQSRGYSIARATLPEQKLDEGVLKIQVIEGRVGQVSFEGNTRTRTRVLQHQAAALKSGDVYTDAAMDRAVSLLNDLPGVAAQAVLQPGTAFGTADVVYKTDEQRLSGQVSADDYGRKDTGRIRLNAAASVDELTGSGDQLSASLTHAEDNLLNFGGLTYSLPVGPDGGRLTADYNQSKYRLATFDITSKTKDATYHLDLGGSTRNATLSWQYAGLRSHDENLYWGIGVEHEGTESTALGKVVGGTDVNVLQLTFFYNRTADDGASRTLAGSFSTNGGQNPDGTSTSAEQAKITLDGNLVEPLGGFSFVGHAGGQWAPDTLTDVDKYSLGGPDSVRGYESAEARGDSGVIASGELQHPLFSSPLSAGWFVDAGKVWTHGPTTTLPCLSALEANCGLKPGLHVGQTFILPGSHATLAASGLELIYTSPSRNWEARLEWALGFGGYKPTISDEGGHIWASVGFNF